MALHPNRGASNKLYEMLRGLPPDTVINVDGAFKLLQEWRPSVTRQAASSALSYLGMKKLLTPERLDGNYRLAPPLANGNGADHSASDDVDTIAIDNLLNAMAAAEPVLRRCKKLIAAFKAPE